MGNQQPSPFGLGKVQRLFREEVGPQGSKRETTCFERSTKWQEEKFGQRRAMEAQKQVDDIV